MEPPCGNRYMIDMRIRGRLCRYSFLRPADWKEEAVSKVLKRTPCAPQSRADHDSDDVTRKRKAPQHIPRACGGILPRERVACRREKRTDESMNTTIQTTERRT